MNKYINAEELLKSIDIRLSVFGRYPKWDFVTMVNEMPSADVVEVVRCKDCKYREKYECNHITLGSTKCGVTDDFYCADGERRTVE